MSFLSEMRTPGSFISFAGGPIHIAVFSNTPACSLQQPLLVLPPLSPRRMGAAAANPGVTMMIVVDRSGSVERARSGGAIQIRAEWNL